MVCVIDECCKKGQFHQTTTARHCTGCSLHHRDLPWDAQFHNLFWDNRQETRQREANVDSSVVQRVSVMKLDTCLISEFCCFPGLLFWRDVKQGFVKNIKQNKRQLNVASCFQVSPISLLCRCSAHKAQDSFLCKTGVSRSHVRRTRLIDGLTPETQPGSEY